jgi:hypothetical protein
MNKRKTIWLGLLVLVVAGLLILGTKDAQRARTEITELQKSIAKINAEIQAKQAQLELCRENSISIAPVSPDIDALDWLLPFQGRRTVNSLKKMRDRLSQHNGYLAKRIELYRGMSLQEKQNFLSNNRRLFFDIFTPDLQAEDLVEIISIIEVVDVIDPRIIYIASTGTNMVEVRTGVNIPLAGHGQILLFEKKNGRWIITDIGSWLS